MPDELLSELFGHKRGAFTVPSRPYRAVGRADSGTVF
jgi:transcriptional regulator with GAF, ATPase, and Fis domain